MYYSLTYDRIKSIFLSNTNNCNHCTYTYLVFMERIRVFIPKRYNINNTWYHYRSYREREIIKQDITTTTISPDRDGEFLLFFRKLPSVVRA